MEGQPHDAQRDRTRCFFYESDHEATIRSAHGRAESTLAERLHTARWRWNHAHQRIVAQIFLAATPIIGGLIHDLCTLVGANGFYHNSGESFRLRLSDDGCYAQIIRPKPSALYTPGYALAVQGRTRLDNPNLLPYALRHLAQLELTDVSDDNGNPDPRTSVVDYDPNDDDVTPFCSTTDGMTHRVVLPPDELLAHPLFPRFDDPENAAENLMSMTHYETRGAFHLIDDALFDLSIVAPELARKAGRVPAF